MTIKKVAIDTCILHLVMCAALNRNPSRDTRLSRYQEADTKIIQDLLCSFQVIVTTPNILSELSNQTGGYEEREWMKAFILSKVTEQYLPSAQVAGNPLFTNLGLTDLGFLSDELGDCTIVSDDEELCEHLRAQGRKYLYYKEYREEYLNLNS